MAGQTLPVNEAEVLPVAEDARAGRCRGCALPGGARREPECRDERCHPAAEGGFPTPGCG